MILHALTRHYEDLLSLGRIPRPGWGTAKVSYALDLSLEGEILALLPLKTEQLRGKKAELLPRKMEVPMPVGRSGTPNGPASVLRPARLFIWSCWRASPPRRPRRSPDFSADGTPRRPPNTRPSPRTGRI